MPGLHIYFPFAIHPFNFDRLRPSPCGPSFRCPDPHLTGGISTPACISWPVPGPYEHTPLHPQAHPQLECASAGRSLIFGEALLNRPLHVRCSLHRIRSSSEQTNSGKCPKYGCQRLQRLPGVYPSLSCSAKNATFVYRSHFLHVKIPDWPVVILPHLCYSAEKGSAGNCPGKTSHDLVRLIFF